MRRAIVVGLVVVLLVAGGVALWLWWANSHRSPLYRSAKLERGDLVQTVRATGTVQPVRQIQIGTQVNGPVARLYVDYNDKVTNNQLVAQIDPTVYAARLAQEDANLKQNLAQVDEAKAKRVQAEKDLARTRELAKRDMMSQADLDAAVASYDALVAQEKVALANVDQEKAALDMARANLGYTQIRVPVAGVILSRMVSEGQTVVASMSAQTLFTMATDLSHINVQATVPEADIGRIRVGQPVSFSVDAYESQFHGVVSQIWFGAAATVQNVVTYPVIISAQNPDGKLFPGMTATILCEVARRADALRVPNAALRFKPQGVETPAAAEPAEKAAGDAHSRGGHGGTRGGHGGPTNEVATVHTIWVPGESDTTPVPVTVTTGITDGSQTELIDAGGLEEGQSVLIGLADPNAAAEKKTVNPFVPQMPSHRGRPPR